MGELAYSGQVERSCPQRQGQMSSAAIVLDADIPINVVLGNRARDLIWAHATTVKFFARDGWVTPTLPTQN